MNLSNAEQLCKQDVGERSANESAAIAVHIFDEFGHAVSASWLEAVCLTVLQQEGIAQHASLVIADDDTARALNAEYRGVDKTTDVLSFAFDNAGEYYGEGDAPSGWSADDDFVLPPGASAGLGEVIVSYPQAARQARQAGHPVERELAFLVVHGILHLIGHDHVDDDDARVMQSKERVAMERVAMERVAAKRTRGSNG